MGSLDATVSSVAEEVTDSALGASAPSSLLPQAPNSPTTDASRTSRRTRVSIFHCDNLSSQSCVGFGSGESPGSTFDCGASIYPVLAFCFDGVDRGKTHLCWNVALAGSTATGSRRMNAFA